MGWYNRMIAFLPMLGIIIHLLSLLIVLLKLLVSRNAQGTILWIRNERIMVRKELQLYPSKLRRLLLLLHLMLLQTIGISLRTQELFLLIFATRCAVLFYSYFYISVFDSLLRILFLVLTATIVYSMRCDELVHRTYDSVHDSFPHWKYAVLPCGVMTMLLYVLQYNVLEQEIRGMLETFSGFLEAIAIAPQLFLLRQVGGCDAVTGLYIFFMFASGLFHLLFFMALDTPAFIDLSYQIFLVSVVVRSMVYVIFFGCMFQSNASLRHKKDDSQLSRTLSSDLEEPLLAEVYHESSTLPASAVDRID
jgi:ER lumen protein retaining receptor